MQSTLIERGHAVSPNSSPPFSHPRHSAPEDMLQQNKRATPREVVRERVVTDAIEIQSRRIRVGETMSRGTEDCDLVVPHPSAAHLCVEVVDIFKGRIRIPGAAICDDVSPD